MKLRPEMRSDKLFDGMQQHDRPFPINFQGKFRLECEQRGSF
ncbi:MAG: hypothetical protein SWY16_10995 [Cyanobacteriota bacterium]|nr:hypothetical protein [Cyanobacteriota bacterium]